MKDYKKVAEDVFRRRDEIIAENKLRRKRLVEIGVSAACWAAVGAVGFGIWKTNIREKNINTVDPQSSTSQGANASLNNSDPISENSVPNNSDNEFIIDGVDIRCLPRHSNVLIGYHTCIDSYDIESEGRLVGVTGVEYGHQLGAGDVMFSTGLINAMAKYGQTDEYGEIYYDVIIGYYKYSSGVEPNMELFESECEKFGKNFFIETDTDGHCYLGTHNATYDMLKNLAPNDEYGYYVYLRGDFFGDTDTSSNKRVYNHGDHTAFFELEGVDFCHPRGKITNIDADIKEPEYSPDNGTVVISQSLKKAIETYGKEDKNGVIDYRVIIEYYKDGKRIESTKELWESESAGGFHSHSSDGGAHWEHYIGSDMTVDRLESFKPNGEYGCVLYLYNAYFGYPYKYDDNIVNGLYNNGVYFE